MTDLRDEFILYLPSTFDFDNVRGTSRDEGAPDDNGGGDDESQSPSDIMLERVVQFQQAIISISEEDVAVAEEEGDDDVVVVDEAEVADSNYNLLSDEVSTTDEYAQLMTDLQTILSATSVENILSKVLPAASCLEGKDNVSGTVRFARKSKSLLWSWIGKAVDSSLGRENLANNEVNIYEKYYNKWFM